jgi:hypothetical protein
MGNCLKPMPKDIPKVVQVVHPTLPVERDIE